MSLKIVLAEKPSVGREIARVLKCKNNKGSYIEGNGYIVTWALGHLVGLMDPEGYGDKYKKWSMETLPMLPKPMKLTVLKKTSKQYNEVKKQLLRNDVEEIIIATDAGREGELVARWIIDKSGVRKKIKRLWISSQTDKAILDGFKNLKDGRAYDNLYKAAVCRAEADWLVGLNVTRALTCKYNAQLSAGRVQSPTLAMIVNREEEIKNFKPEDYYNLKALTDKFTLSWVSPKGNSNIFKEEVAKSILDKTKNSTGEVIDVTKSRKKKYSPALYDLTELQRDANKIWGYSAKQTLNIMQRLYENYKLLTYPRTDSRYISSDILPTIPDRLRGISVGEYRAYADKLLKQGVKGNKSFVDNSKVSDHHAIIPTEEKLNLGVLSSEEKNIYNLVVKRFLSVMLPPYEYEQTTIKVNINGEIFLAKGNITLEKGWKALYQREDLDDEDGTQELPTLKVNDKLNIRKIELIKKQTTPPGRFNEGTLLSAMENPHKYINVGKDAAKTLGETGGLGTVATRADIIEKLFNSFLIEQKGKDILITSKGKQLLDLVPTELRTPELTSSWEKKLQDISKGKLNKNIFIKEMKDYSKDIVKEIKNSDSKFKHDNLTKNRCPECGKYMLEVKGKRGKMLVCEDRECNTRKTVSQITNSRCPVCHKKLELRGEGEAKTFICSCGHREKLSAYNKRKQEDKNKASKKDINKYLKSQNKDVENFNNPFAQALAKLKK